MINSLHIAILLLFTLATVSKGQSCLKLVYSDEFEGNSIDLSKWNFEVQGPGWVNNELQKYTDNRAENARIENGSLVLEARIDNFEGHKYSSARIHSNHKMSIHQGRMEFRAKLPGGRGTWPALWMMPNDIFKHATTCSEQSGWTENCDAWPNSGEIDVMEYVGYDPGVIHGSAHTKNANFQSGGNFTSHISISNETSQFHVYAIEWRENSIEWFVDDQSYGLLQKTNDSWEDWPFDQDFHAILNIAVGGSWGGAQGMDDSIFPVQMVVDYVRMYEFDTEGGQEPFLGQMHMIPGVIEAEDYDEGCNGVAYYDIDGTNVGGAYRNDGVDIEASNNSNGSNVGWIDSGEWLEYTFNSSLNEDVDLFMATASLSNGGNVSIYVDDVAVVSNFDLPVTGSWTDWEFTHLKTFNLEAGEHTLQVYANDGAFNIDYLEFRSIIMGTNVNSQLDVEIFPNVVDAALHVRSQGDTNYQVYNTVGFKIHEGNIARSGMIPFEGLEAGVYNIVFESQQKMAVRKVIKR